MKSIEVLKDMLTRTDVVAEKAALGEGIMALKREQVPDRDWGEYCPNCGRRVTVCDNYCKFMAGYKDADDEKYGDLVNKYCVSCPLNKL